MVEGQGARIPRQVAVGLDLAAVGRFGDAPHRTAISEGRMLARALGTHGFRGGVWPALSASSSLNHLTASSGLPQAQ